ncbi:OLC1v1020853C1 [Oldenlandia corymbosa var. corymbosa]|uniref:OLC1v1020853C1 n=1 Tax=Oldenlandia corymbosa var. corymbosa TaxID=529605 RepID=A0AAV1BWT8_OLDCO|nr:OLC1v1020853C1 [Oldenlandia corymbosa var. corymbosa]
MTSLCSSLYQISPSLPRLEVKSTGRNPWRLNLDVRAQPISNRKNDGGGGGRRRVWRRRKLTKRDEFMEAKLERVPFLEEQVRTIRDGGKLWTMDVERLLLSEDNRFDFVNEVAAEAISYVKKNRDEYGFKKAILHVLSNRMNDTGVYRPEAYMETDPFKPGPGYLREENF